MNDNYLEIAKIISERRKQLGLSMRQLALLAEVSHTEISRIESGKREKINLNILFKICKVLNLDFVSIINLLEHSNKEETKNNNEKNYEVILNKITQTKYKVSVNNEYEIIERIENLVLNDDNFLLNENEFIEYEIRTLN